MASMRLAASVGVCLAALLAAGGARAEDRFLSAISDLPLMPGLTEMADSAVVFSKPEGRIVEVAAQGPVQRSAVLAFYRRTLPQLGWQVAGEGRFVRERERLDLAFDHAAGRLVVQFSLAPR